MRLLRPGPLDPRMSVSSRTLPLVGTAPLAPSRDGLSLVVAGMGYLLAVCLLQGVVVLGRLLGRPSALPPDVFDLRDVIALFGWVGLMISGVSVIIVPNHLKVRLRPRSIPRVHLVLANVGLVGLFASSLAAPATAFANGFLLLVSLSYFVFGASVFATVLPFLRSRTRGAAAGRQSPRAAPPTDPPTA